MIDNQIPPSLRQTTTCRTYKENVQGMFHFKNTREEQGRRNWENFFGDSLILNPPPSPAYRPPTGGLGHSEQEGERGSGREKLTSLPTLLPPLSSSCSVGDWEELAPLPLPPTLSQEACESG